MSAAVGAGESRRKNRGRRVAYEVTHRNEESEATMQLTPTAHTAPGGLSSYVLLVSDWAVDPHAVVAAAIRRDESRRSAFGLLVPAWLHGLDWAGDPRASLPCAQRQLAAIGDLAAAAGLDVEIARVGDPEPVTAICDAVHEWHADEVLLCVRAHRLALGPFDVGHRAERLTGLPVRRVDVLGPASRARHLGVRKRAGHCMPDAAAAG